VTHITVVSSVEKTSVRTGKAIVVMLASMVAIIVPMATVTKAFHLALSLSGSEDLGCSF